MGAVLIVHLNMYCVVNAERMGAVLYCLHISVTSVGGVTHYK